jgi:hypothetical protein
VPEGGHLTEVSCTAHAQYSTALTSRLEIKIWSRGLDEKSPEPRTHDVYATSAVDRRPEVPEGSVERQMYAQEGNQATIDTSGPATTDVIHDSNASADILRGMLASSDPLMESTDIPMNVQTSWFAEQAASPLALMTLNRLSLKGRDSQSGRRTERTTDKECYLEDVTSDDR